MVFRKVDGLEEEDIEMRDLEALTLADARREAQACVRPEGANMIIVLREGLKVGQIPVGI